MISAAEPVLELIPIGNVQTTVVLVLAVGVLYFRKALGLGSVLADWAGRLMFAAVVLLALLLTGIVPQLDIGAARSIVSRLTGWVTQLLGVVT